MTARATETLQGSVLYVESRKAMCMAVETGHLGHVSGFHSSMVHMKDD